MFGLTTGLEARLALWALLLAGIAASYIYTHHEGYESCHAPQVAAQKAQKASDTIIDTGVGNESDQSKAGLATPGGIAAGPPPRLPGCVRVPSRLPARPAAGQAQPGELASSGNDQGLLSGAEPETPVDYGPVVQVIATAGVLVGTNGELLWKRDVEQSKPIKP